MVTSKSKAKTLLPARARQKHGHHQEQGKSLDNSKRKSKAWTPAEQGKSMVPIGKIKKAKCMDTSKSTAKAWSPARAKQKHGHQQEQGKSMVTSKSKAKASTASAECQQ
jgi:hypothetical protein